MSLTFIYRMHLLMTYLTALIPAVVVPLLCWVASETGHPLLWLGASITCWYGVKLMMLHLKYARIAADARDLEARVRRLKDGLE